DAKIFSGVFPKVPQGLFQAVERPVQRFVKVRVPHQMSHLSFAGVKPREERVDLFQRVRDPVVTRIAFEQRAGRALARIQSGERVANAPYIADEVPVLLIAGEKVSRGSLAALD